MKIFLAGFPGSGKTFLGKAAAEQLDVPFFDTDAMIAEATGSSIQEIFTQKGEDFFRKKESEVLRFFESKRKCIVALGGGTPCFGNNMEWMNANGITVYLEASAAFLYHRLVKEKKSRPLMSKLTDIELMIWITETLAARSPFYKLAKITINAETATTAKIVSALKKQLAV